MRKLRTYLLLLGHCDRAPNLQRALFESNLNDELKKYMQMELEENHGESNLTNMLVALQHIFDKFYPRCTRC